MYAIIGIVLGLTGAAIAFARAHGAASFYAHDVYHMTERSHRTFAYVSLAFAAAFSVALKWSALAVPFLAVYILVFILYASSFARGFTGEDE